MNQPQTAQTISFDRPIRSFTLHNAAVQPHTVAFIGRQWTLPARDQVQYPNEKFEDVPFSAKDADGDWIPGTIIINDGRIGGQYGEEERFFDAQQAVLKILGVENGVALGFNAKRGVSLLPEAPTKDVWRAIAAAGQRQYEESVLQNAQNVLNALEAANEKRRRRGDPEMPGDRVWHQARQILERAVREDNARIDTIFGHGETTGQPEPDEGELALAVAVKAKALAVRELPNGTEEQRLRLAQELVSDPETSERIKRSLPKKAADGPRRIQVTPREPQAAQAVALDGAEASAGGG